jgi:hypothetical protein
LFILRTIEAVPCVYSSGFLHQASPSGDGSLTRLGVFDVCVSGCAAAKFEAEKVAEEEAKKEFSKQEKASKKLQGGLRNLAEVRHPALPLAPPSTAPDCFIR